MVKISEEDEKMKRRYPGNKEVYNVLKNMDADNIPAYTVKELHEWGYLELKRPHKKTEWHLTEKGKKFYKKWK